MLCREQKFKKQEKIRYKVKSTKCRIFLKNGIF